jgi:hypothetical protein
MGISTQRDSSGHPIAVGLVDPGRHVRAARCSSGFVVLMDLDLIAPRTGQTALTQLSRRSFGSGPLYACKLRRRGGPRIASGETSPVTENDEADRSRPPAHALG